MKLLHISDLHIGKKIKGFSLIEDQKYILNQIIEVALREKVDGILIAGDIYDCSIPTIEAVNLFDSFISRIHREKIACYAVSGNHDNISRVTFGSNIMAEENIYFAKKYAGNITPIDAGEDVKIWLLPFIRPLDIREYYPDFSNCSYEEMMQNVMKNLEIDESKTNILVAHQFVTNNGVSPERSESETVSLGTLDNIDISNFEKFDYVALGHIHKSQAMGSKFIRYGGSPLKYSFSEKNDKKAMVILNISKKNVDIDFIPYEPLKDMKEFAGTFDELMSSEKCNDYVRIVLKDEDYITDVKHKLEAKFSNIMEIAYDNAFTREDKELQKLENVKTQTPLDLFKTFYEIQNNRELDEEQTKVVTDVFRELNVEVDA